MKKEFKKNILNRISYTIGHLEGIKKMIESDKYCICVIDQNKAVISAIKKINDLILENHLNSCVVESIKGNNPKEREKKIEELLKVFKNSN